MDNYSTISNDPPGHERIAISEIKKGDVFTFEGAEDGALYRATKDVYWTDDRSGLLIEAEDVDFKPVVFAHAKNSLGYAPKYYKVEL